MILEVLLTLSIIFNGVLIWGLIRAVNVHTAYETTFEEYDGFYQELQSRLVKTISTMKEIDIRGSFESDDEVGSVFQQIQAMIGALDVFILAREGESDASEK
jgi:hypothetical protein